MSILDTGSDDLQLAAPQDVNGSVQHAAVIRIHVLPRQYSIKYRTRESYYHFLVQSVHQNKWCPLGMYMMSSVLPPYTKLYVPTFAGRLMSTGRYERFGIITFRESRTADATVARLNEGQAVRLVASDVEWCVDRSDAQVLVTCRHELAQGMHSFLVHMCNQVCDEDIVVTHSYERIGDSITAREILWATPLTIGTNRLSHSQLAWSHTAA